MNILIDCCRHHSKSWVLECANTASILTGPVTIMCMMLTGLIMASKLPFSVRGNWPGTKARTNSKPWKQVCTRWCVFLVDAEANGLLKVVEVVLRRTIVCISIGQIVPVKCSEVHTCWCFLPACWGMLYTVSCALRRMWTSLGPAPGLSCKTQYQPARIGCSLMLDHRGACVVNEVSGTKALARVKNGQFRIVWNGPSSSNSLAHTLSNAFTSPCKNTFALLRLRYGGHQPWYSMIALLLGCWMLSNFRHDDSSTTKFLWMLALHSSSSPWWCNQPWAPWQATGWVLKIKNYLVYPPFLVEGDSRTQQIWILVCNVC